MCRNNLQRDPRERTPLSPPWKKQMGRNYLQNGDRFRLEGHVDY